MGLELEEADVKLEPVLDVSKFCIIFRTLFFGISWAWRFFLAWIIDKPGCDQSSPFWVSQWLNSVKTVHACPRWFCAYTCGAIVQRYVVGFVHLMLIVTACFRNKRKVLSMICFFGGWLRTFSRMVNDLDEGKGIRFGKWRPHC